MLAWSTFRTPRRLALALVFLLAVATVTAHAANQSRVFQQGRDGYTGVHDTWISASDWDTPSQDTVNYGRNQDLVLTRDGRENPLLHFDLSAIPANSAVVSATLWLYNTTPSSWSGTRNFPRRVNLFRVLGDWDEGNQVASPIDAPGKHGATGFNAFDYYLGEGADVAWAERGMAPGPDYATLPESHADVVNPGWYSWNVTALVRAQVRGEQANFGLVLRDSTGYEDDHMDWRTFVSSQNTQHPKRRPKLAISYNPDTPYAKAGPDQEHLSWNGGALTLDGSGSRDRPGGDDAGLHYQWSILKPAYGSTMGGDLASGPNPIISFTPDACGEWEIRLVVSNPLGESASDTVRLRLLQIPAGHPRIYLTPAKLADLRGRAIDSNPRWVQLKNEADSEDGEMHAKALVSQVSGDPATCLQAVNAALDLMANTDDWATKAGDVALVYDWCHAQLTAGQRTVFIDYLNNWAEHGITEPYDNDISGWGNYWPRYGYSYALVGLATYGDNPRAGEWLDEYRHRRYRDHDLPLLNRIAAGGGWPEGMIYDWIANWPRVKALEAWRSAAGENLFAGTPWYRNRLGYILLHRWPGVAEQWGNLYHPYVSTGDTERNRGSIANYERIMALILIERFPDLPLARQLQSYLAAPPTGNSASFLYHEEYLWFNPDQPRRRPNLLTHYAKGTGTLFMRSGWPDGAADKLSEATHITFQAGDHFSYHQHYDQNSFTLFKYGDLAVDSGVYSGDGRSHHDINYYVRSIAHNTLVVYNPLEDFSTARPEASSNDGGQRTLSPASRSPQDVAYFDQHAVHYDTGDMVRFENKTGYTYALGDATKAYNNPSYHQAMDTGFSDNVAKVSRFQREFVYLRPESTGAPDYVVLYDRVGVTREAFSGQNTKLLFHTLNTPTVNGTAQTISPGEHLYTGADLVTVTAGGGKLFIKSLLPVERHIRRVGQRGDKAFWVFDANYDWHWDSGEPQPRPTSDFEDNPYGEWRTELEPADTALEHNFLTVLSPVAKETPAMVQTVTIIGAGVEGVHIADPVLNRIALFSSAHDGSAPAGAISYSCQPSAGASHLLFDLTPGARYSLATSSAGGVQTVTLAPDSGGALQAGSQGVLEFMLPPADSSAEARNR